MFFFSFSFRFSVNFVNEHCKKPAFITYHFKWLLDINAIVENYKDNDIWINHLEKDFDGIDGVLYDTKRNNDNTDDSFDNNINNNNNNDNSNSNNNYSLLGPIFELEFAFAERYIDVYRIILNTPNYVTSYEPYFSYSDIKAIQVWGDVKQVTDISFKYATK